MDEIKRRVRTPDAARYVGLAKRTLEKMRITGDGPRFYKLGRAVVYDTQDLDAWLLKRARRSTSDPGRCSA